ncbi:hypothetical protein GIB67_025374 [Kingdonia uniflora]|uniref:Uncharacterized protein n=1 Tax=Kingdonia uniflora TaxID=39325 RepID=A0A7J7NCG9_9MAGN|nr:hypothetical protein GIB67_025374 [Kingdonia uniflora]
MHLKNIFYRYVFDLHRLRYLSFFHLCIYIYIYIYISLVNRLHITYIFNIYIYVRQHISHTSLLTFSIRMRIGSRVKFSPHNAAVLPSTRSRIFRPLQPFITFR